MPTIREVAEQYGVSKSTMRRWVKECLPDVFDGQRVDLNDAQMHQLARHISERGLAPIRDDAKRTASRTVHRTDDDALLERVHELEVENASLRAMNDSLNRSYELLVERLRVADAALQREQMQARGFWSRLGQKLLGEGRKTDDSQPKT